jgi:hypothetical protein
LVDIIENIKGSVIQHGPHNKRIYLMRLNTDDPHGLIATKVFSIFVFALKVELRQ